MIYDELIECGESSPHERNIHIWHLETHSIAYQIIDISQLRHIYIQIHSMFLLKYKFSCGLGITSHHPSLRCYGVQRCREFFFLHSIFLPTRLSANVVAHIVQVTRNALKPNIGR